MRATAFLRVRASGVLRETFAFNAPQQWHVGSATLKPSLLDASSWSNKFIVNLGCDLQSANSPTTITKKYGHITDEKLPRRLHALMRGDLEDGLVNSISKCLKTLRVQGREAPVDAYVGDVLRGCDLDDGKKRKLFPKEQLTFQLGSLEVTCKPDHLLRCTGVVNVVTQERKVDSTNGHAMGQVVAAMLAAAFHNLQLRPTIPPPSVYAIRVVGTRWTFFRADFTEDYLTHLSDYKLLPDDRFRVLVWGGPLSRTTQKTGELHWGLDYENDEERRDLVRMIAALGEEAEEVALKLL